MIISTFISFIYLSKIGLIKNKSSKQNVHYRNKEKCKSFWFKNKTKLRIGVRGGIINVFKMS